MVANAPPPVPLDPELEALPEPRRPFRCAALALLGATAIASTAMAWALRGDAAFSLRTGPPRELGALTHVQLDPGAENTWVHVTGPLAAQAAEYRRPVDPDRFRLVRTEGNPHLWVELRVPAELEPERYVAPNSFVGRLVSFEQAGLRYRAVADAGAILGDADSGSRNAWLLIDGEAPATTRWAIGLIALFLAFATFSVWGIVRLQRAVHPNARGDTP